MFGQDRLEQNDRAVGTTLVILKWALAIVIAVGGLVAYQRGQQRAAAGDDPAQLSRAVER